MGGPLDLSRFSCPRPDCDDYGVRGKDNLVPHVQYGSGHWTLIRCRTCRNSFSERQFSPLYPLRIPPEKVVRILTGLSRRESTRSVAATEGVSTAAIQNVFRLAEERQAAFRNWLLEEQQVRQDVVRDIVHFLTHHDELKRKNGKS